MQKKQTNFRFNFTYTPHPSGKTSEEVILGVFFDFVIQEVARKHNCKLSISREEYIRRVSTREMGLYAVVHYFESLNHSGDINEIVKDIISLQYSHYSLSYDTAKRNADILQSFVDMVEEYKPYSLETAIIHEYAIHGNVVIAAEELNKKGYRDNGKTIKSSHISSVLMRSPVDDLHKIVSNQFRKNKGLDSF